MGRYYGMTVHTCVPYDPESKGGSESTVKIAKADLVPAEANLLEAYGSFAELAQACRQFCEVVNGRVHRETCAVPAQRLEAERARLHPLPDAPHTAALGHDPDREHRPDGPVRQRAVFGPAGPGGGGGVGPRRGG